MPDRRGHRVRPPLPRRTDPRAWPHGVRDDLPECVADKLGSRGRALVDRELHLPKSWAEDGERCRSAEVPDERSEFATKGELARRMVLRPPYEVRRDVGCYRHITLAMLAHAFLAVTAHQAGEMGSDPCAAPTLEFSGTRVAVVSVRRSRSGAPSVWAFPWLKPG